MTIAIITMANIMHHNLHKKSTLEIKSDDDQKAVEEAIKIAKQV